MNSESIAVIIPCYNEALTIGKVIEGEKGLFIAMPSKRALDGEYRDIAHPINSGTRDRIQKIILDKYAEVLEETDDAETAEI